MEVIVDTHIYKLHPNGGICRIFNETLPRMCDLDKQLKFLMLHHGISKDEIPIKHQRVIYSHIQQLLRQYKTKEYTNVLIDKIYSKLLNRLLRGAGNNQIWHSTYYTMPETWKGKRVVTVADLIGEKFQLWGKEFFPEKERRWMQNCIETADAVSCISETTKNDLLEIYPKVHEDTVHVVHLAAGGEFKKMESFELSKELHFIDKPFFMFIGHRDYYKNFKVICDAFSKWKDKNDFFIIAVGKPAEEEEKKYWQEKGISNQVKVLSGLNDDLVCELYNKATAFIYPSLYEGFGIPLLEAMQCGCPIIASDIPSSREIAQNCPIYFSPQDENELIQAMDSIIKEDKDSERLAHGYDRAKSFSWDTTAQKTLEIYQSLS